LQFQICGRKSWVLRSQIEFTQRHLTKLDKRIFATIKPWSTVKLIAEAGCVTYWHIFLFISIFWHCCCRSWFKVLLIYKVCLRPGPSNIFLISFFYTILLNFVAQVFPFSNKITKIYFWSIACCLKSIQ
jgi:hypothetical protein